ncbi:MAG: phage holin family protein [Deltaproteobacteria bacterium]|jgi:putative membrane protein|nr:phage holin family protein [Deltaproteobacteria bacterium]
MSYLVSFVVLLVSLVVAARLLDGMEIKGGLGSHVLVGLIFGVLNAILGPALFAAIGIGTLGIGFLLSFVTRLIATAIVLKIVDALTDRLRVKDFKTAFLAALLMSLTTSVCEVVIDFAFSH